MSALQFLILIAAAETDPRRLSRTVRAAQTRCGLRSVFETERLVVLASSSTRVAGIGPGRGVVLGTLFRRTPAASGDYEPATVLPDGGADVDTLVRDYWGSYVAVIDGQGASIARVVRDPAGGFGCYLTQSDGLWVLFSDADQAQALGLVSADLDPAPIVHALAFQAWPFARTGLAGVEEMQPGTRLRVEADGGLRRNRSWDPWRFTHRSLRINDPRAAAAAVGEETQRCVSAWASQADSILLELSGGLDSSIVGACLRGRRGGLTLINLATPDPGADERVYAQLVADQLGAPLKTLQLDPADARLDPPNTLAPRPTTGLLHQTIDAALLREAAAVGADAFFSGGGGDNVFCYLSTAAPATDVLLDQGPGPRFVQAVGDLAALHNCSAWEAGRLALRKTWRGPRRWPQDLDFLNPDAVPPFADRHPWHEGASAARPGTREHVDLVLAVQTALIGHQRQGLAPMRFPLLSQPLVELCLRIPTWLWIAGGRNRAVARDAFAGRLPARVLQRRTKGDFMGLLGELYRQHRPALPALLLDGWLAEQGVLDRTAIEAYLRSTAPTTDLRFFRLLELAKAELWARSWQALPRGRVRL
jgi:asparagine synthase (glutamine-hydrolysing)